MSARLFSFQPVRPVFGSAKCFGCRSVRMRTAAATKRHAVRCNASTPDAASSEPKLKLTRRATLVSLAGVAIGTTADVSHPLAAEAKQTAQVGTYLPPSDIEGFSLFVPDRSKTPALRAGTVDRDDPYRFSMPSTWRESQVANIQSGNYCQPRCAEPWTEVIFSDDSQGQLQVLVSPLQRLTNQAQAPIEDVGTPEGILSSLGAYITGNYLDEDDVQSIQKKEFDGRTYYLYEVTAPYGKIGPHTLTMVTTKGDLLLAFAIAATDKQWAKSEKKLRQMLETFRA